MALFKKKNVKYYQNPFQSKANKNVFNSSTYDVRTKTYTDSSGNKYSMAEKNVPLGTSIIKTSTPNIGGNTPNIGGNNGSQQVQLQQSKAPTQYYGEVSLGSPNLNKLKNLTLKNARERFIRSASERIIQLKKQPIRTTLNLGMELQLTPFKIAGGIQTLTQAEAERRAEQLSKLQNKIERKEREGKFTGLEKIYKAKLGFEKGVLRATSDTAGLIAFVPKLPEATYLFITNQPFAKIKKFIDGMTLNKIYSTKSKVVNRIKNNPFESASYIATQYFLFGNKLVGKSKLKTGQKIEKIIIKENKVGGYQNGLFFKWTSKQRPVLIKFRTQLNADLSKLKKKLNEFVNKLKKEKKFTEGTIKPYYKDIKTLELPKKPITKIKPIIKGNRNIEITFREHGWDSLPLKEQAKLIGKTLNLVSAQAERLVYLLRRSRMIQKPISGLQLTKKGLILLNKLNRGGKLTRLETSYLNKLFRQSNKGLLAKSFFASPSTRVRVSRLGLSQREAGLIDVFKGNFQLKRNKPQILLFVNQRISNLPKNLVKIKNKLLSGKSLTNNEAMDLLTFQLKKTGRFKPIGFLTREAEVTLAPNEIIRRIKRLTSVRIGGRTIPVIQAEVVKIKSPYTRNLMNRLNKGATLTKEEIRKLNKGIQKESGLKSSYKSYKGTTKPYLTLKSKLLSFSIYYKKGKPINYYPRFGKGTIYEKGGSGFLKPKPPIPYPHKPTPYNPKGTPPYKYKPEFPYNPKGTPPAKKKLWLQGRLFRSEKKKSGKQGFNVYGLSKGKFIKLNKKPLLKPDALSRGTYAIDRTTAKTFKIVPVGYVKAFGGLIKREKGYYTKTGYKFKQFKVRKGKAYALIMKQIEKKKYGIDTSGEVAGLTLAKYLRKLKGGKY